MGLEVGRYVATALAEVVESEMADGERFGGKECQFAQSDDPTETVLVIRSEEAATKDSRRLGESAWRGDGSVEAVRKATKNNYKREGKKDR